MSSVINYQYPYEVRYEAGCKVVTQTDMPIRYMPEPYTLVKPLLVEKEQWYDEVTGEREGVVWTHPPTETWAESISALKRGIIMLYEDLVEAPDSQLGKLPLAWKQLLLKHIKVNNDT